jgi:hypothetical protein
MIHFTRYTVGILAVIWMVGAPMARAATDAKTKVSVDCEIVSVGDMHVRVIPCVVTVTNRSTKERLVELSLETDVHDYRDSAKTTSTKRVKVAPGKSTSVEIPACLTTEYYGGMVSLSVTVDGSPSSALQWSDWLPEAYGSSGLHCLLIGRDSYSLDQRGVLEDETYLRIPLSEAFTDWRMYMGLQGMVFISGDDLAKLSAEQRLALRRWVVLGGGILCLVDDKPQSRYNLLQLNNGGYVQQTIPNVGKYQAMGRGLLISCSNDRFKRLEDRHLVPLQKLVESRVSLFDSSASESNQAHLLNGLMEIPRGIYTFIAILLLALIGPVNYFWLKKRKKQFFFFLTAAGLATVGSLLLVGVITLQEGFSVKERRVNLLYHDLDTGSGMMYQSAGYYSGLSRSNIQYTPKTLAWPFRQNTDKRADYRSSFTPDLTLQGGWIRARKPSGIITVTPVTPRLGIFVTEKEGTVWIENQLPNAAEQVSVKFQGAYYYLESLNSGETKQLQPIHQRNVSQWRRDIQRSIDSRSLVPVLDLYSAKQQERYGTMVQARILGELPYREETDLDAEPLEPTYSCYVSTGAGS